MSFRNVDRVDPDHIVEQRPRTAQLGSHDPGKNQNARATALLPCRSIARHFAKIAVIGGAEIILEQSGLLTGPQPLLDSFIFQLERRRLRQGPLRFGSLFGHSADNSTTRNTTN